MFPSDEAMFKILYFSLTKYQLVTHTRILSGQFNFAPLIGKRIRKVVPLSI